MAKAITYRIRVERPEGYVSEYCTTVLGTSRARMVEVLREREDVDSVQSCLPESRPESGFTGFSSFGRTFAT